MRGINNTSSHHAMVKKKQREIVPCVELRDAFMSRLKKSGICSFKSYLINYEKLLYQVDKENPTYILL